MSDKKTRKMGPNASKVQLAYATEGLDAALALGPSVTVLKKAHAEYSADFECEDWTAYMEENHPAGQRGLAPSPPQIGEKRKAKAGGPKDKPHGTFLRVPCEGLIERGAVAELAYRKDGIFIPYKTAA